MAFDGGNIHYEYDPNGVNEIIDELSPTSYLSLRSVRWSEDGDFKLDLRRYFVKQDESEMPGKGCSIHNPNRLANVLFSNGFGDTETIARELFCRDDWNKGVGTVLADMNDTEYKKFKKDMDTARDEAIKNRGMSSDDFLGALA